MAFQVSVTHRFLLTPFCQWAAEETLGKGVGVRKERTRAEMAMGRDRGEGGVTKASHRDSDSGAI